MNNTITITGAVGGILIVVAAIIVSFILFPDETIMFLKMLWAIINKEHISL